MLEMDGSRLVLSLCATGFIFSLGFVGIFLISLVYTTMGFGFTVVLLMAFIAMVLILYHYLRDYDFE